MIDRDEDGRPIDPRPRTDLDCTLWYCVACHASGVVTMDAPDARMVYGVIQTISEAHRCLSSACESAATRVIRPENWFINIEGIQ